MEILEVVDEPGPDMAGKRARTSPNYAPVLALLDAEGKVKAPALDFTATQSEANAARQLGNDYLKSIGRDDTMLSIARWSRPPYGPGRSGTWRARLVRRTS